MMVTILKNFVRSTRSNIRSIQYQIRTYSIKENEKEVEKEPEIPKNKLEGMYSAQNQSETGKIYDKKPFKMICEAGKIYTWCICGQSKGQPLCDGTHRNIFLKIKMRPIKFQVKETKEYWICNCKQTSNRPFCDGTHLRADIQEKKFL